MTLLLYILEMSMLYLNDILAGYINLGLHFVSLGLHMYSLPALRHSENWLFSPLKYLDFSALIFQMVSLYVKSSSSIVLLLSLVVNYIVTFLLKMADLIIFGFWSFFELNI